MLFIANTLNPCSSHKEAIGGLEKLALRELRGLALRELRGQRRSPKAEATVRSGGRRRSPV